MGVAGTVPSWVRGGFGFGSGVGSGYGYGLAEGDIAGSVQSVHSVPRRITSAMLRKAGACSDGICAFERTFPDGAEYPRDIEAARRVGLDVSYLASGLGLPVPAKT